MWAIAVGRPSVCISGSLARGVGEDWIETNHRVIPAIGWRQGRCEVRRTMMGRDGMDLL